MIEFEQKYGCIAYGDQPFCIQEIDEDELTFSPSKINGTYLSVLISNEFWSDPCWSEK